eukprot:Partr_v1_DN24012_c1_g1_i3_m34694 putative s-phase kinase-associated protein
MSESRIQVSTGDGIQFQLDRSIAVNSLLLRNILQDMGDSDNVVIPLPNIQSDIFSKMLQWLEHHKTDSLDSSSGAALIAQGGDTWDDLFLTSCDKDTLFKIILAANYLDIKPLLDLGCRILASYMRGREPEDIRQLFGLTNDFSPEEEDRIRQENEWTADISS